MKSFFFFFSNLIASFADFLVFFFLKLLLFRLQSIATPYFFYNSLIEIKFTDLAVHSLNDHSQDCTPVVTGNFRTYCYTKKKAYTLPAIASQPRAPAGLRQPWICFLFPPIGLSWTFLINGIQQHMVLCDWLLSASASFMVPPLLVQRPPRCIFLKGCQRQDTCVYRRIFEHGWLSWIRLCSHCREWQCCVLGRTHTHVWKKGQPVIGLHPGSCIRKRGVNVPSVSADRRCLFILFLPLSCPLCFVQWEQGCPLILARLSQHLLEVLPLQGIGPLGRWVNVGSSVILLISSWSFAEAEKGVALLLMTPL